MGRPVPPRHPAVCYRKHRPTVGTRGAAPRGPGIAAVFLLRLHGRPSRGCEELLEARVWGTRQVTWDSGSHLPSRCLSVFMTGQDLPQAWGQPPSPDPQPGRHTEPLLTRTSQTHTLTGARACVHTKMHTPRHTCVLTHVYARTRAHPHPAGLLAGLQSRAWPAEMGQKTLDSSQSRVCSTLCCQPTCCKLQSRFRRRKERPELTPAAVEDEQEGLCPHFPRRTAEDGIYHRGEPGTPWTCLPPGATRQPLGQASLAGSPAGGLRVSARWSPGSWRPPRPTPSTAQIYPKAPGCTPASSFLTGNLNTEAVCAELLGKAPGTHSLRRGGSVMPPPSPQPLGSHHL